MSLAIGRSEFRLEDDPLVRGQGRYGADVRLDNETALVVLRSPAASGEILTLDVSAARSAPGVLAVLTADDLPFDTPGFKPVMLHPAPGGGEMFIPPYRPLSSGFVRYVGDPIAVVVAETRSQAEAALEMIELDIDPLDALVDPISATREGAPDVWPECPGNVAFRVEKGDRARVEEAFAQAAHVVEQQLDISRVTAVALEPRMAMGVYDSDGDSYTLHTSTQAPHRVASGLGPIIGVDGERVRVITRDTGGSFGMKNAPYPEQALVLFAAKKVGRPVRWQAERVESFMADSHSREQIVDAALALDADGNFLALKAESKANIGAYLGPMSTHSMVANLGGLSGVYRTPAIFVAVEGIFTNTQNMAPYRGAGRPEATYIIERMASIAAGKLGMDAAEIRRRNMILAHEMPYKTGLILTYDCGDFPAVLDQTLEAADWAGFEARRAEAKTRGLLRGIGISCPIEIAGGPQGNPNPEYAHVIADPSGQITVELGAGDSGQGHRTTFARIVGRRLGVDPAEIEYVFGDTGRVAKGTGTFGSRTSSAAGTALTRAVDVLIEKAREKAVDILEAAPADLEFEAGMFTVAGTDRAVALLDIVRESGTRLEADDFSSADGATFPNGCHVCEVEIEPETGETRVVRYTVVDDVGTVLNQELVDGQIHGGVVQGVGQAMMERILYEQGSGQLISASFMDYAMPRAADFPSISVDCHPVPTAMNPLGVKGAGEAGVVGALPAAINAVADALAALGIGHIDMPTSPERVWAAIQAAK